MQILYNDNGTNKVRAVVNKWKFQDAMMGEQYITFTVSSEKPIDWAIGDFCEFRGQTYTLNYVPSVTQKAGTNEKQDAYTYENVKFESFQEELTRCIMLDITATSGSYIAALGTNYTGSSKFTLFCGETSINGGTLTAVCALAAKMQANLDRLYTSNGWTIYVDTTTSFVDATGVTVLATHTEDKVLTFDNTTVAQALAEVHNTFELDYCIRGREIYIGYNLKNLTSDNDNETFSFAYGKGYPTRSDMNKGLFQIKRISNPQQKIVTRLRALGSTKNMPYRYYNKKYATTGSDLSQTLFPTNLQLPDTFLPEGGSSDAAGTNTKWGHNNQRDSSLAKVKGNTNDAYIDKNDDAEGCDEGIREECARWDGSNGDLPEIYPTIEEATYGELRNALVVDQDGNTGNGSFPNYSANERVDKLLAIGYKEDGSLIDDANKGDGILPESGLAVKGIPRTASIGATYLSYDAGSYGDFSYLGQYYVADEDKTLFTIHGVNPGKYAMAPTLGAVIFGFSLSCYRDGCSCEVGFILTVKQKNLDNGTVSTIASYVSDFVSINRSSGIVEVELPELPDVVNGANAKVSEIVVSAMSDIIVEFTPTMKNVVVPSGFTDSFSVSYQVGNSRLDHTVTAEPEYTWFPVDDEDTITDRFHVFVQDMGFDFEACWSDETPVVAMKSGYCVGREFEILEDIEKVSHNGKKGYMLTLKRAEDSSINAYYPSETNPIAAGDHFVLLGIQMPDVYVKAAEVRLLRAATQFLADNCETKFTYQPYIDDIYLQRNYDNMVKAGTPEASVFWRLYAGLKFTFRGVPANETDPLPLADITIEKVSITMGEGLTPKVELTLNDDVQQGTIQKLTTSVDRIYNGSIFSGGSAGVGATGAMSAALMSILQSEGGNLFLSKIKDDTAEGKITFNDVVTHNETLKAKKGVKVGNFQSRFLGSGALIDEQGNAEFESIYSRSFISTPEFRFNRISVTEGEQWCTNGYGTIQEVEIVDDLTGYITLKLEENDYTSLAVGDICRGIYNDIAHQYETASLDDDTELYAGQNESNIEGFGFSSKQGFFTSYFWIRSFVVNKKGECKFFYELRNSGIPHPCEFMKFAQYGSFTNPERRSSSYATSIGHYYEMVLDGVSTWKIQSPNVVYRKGYLGDMTVTLKNGEEAELQGYGLYVQDNVYFGNAIVQLDPLTLSDIEEELSNYTVDFASYVDVITVDDVGNCIGGLYTINSGSISYRIHSAITVRKSGNLLTLAANNADAGAGTYKIYADPHNCACYIENSTIYITAIDNIKDGVAGSSDDANFDYDAMRAMDFCYVDLIIDCEGKGSIQKLFPITIKHDSQPFVGADISNEFSAVSWNTRTHQYVGLPIDFDLKLWHNNEPLNVSAIALTSSDITLVESSQAASGDAATKIIYTKDLETVTVGLVSYVIGRISIISVPESAPTVMNINVTATATYSGVSYERTLVHTINKSTDTNVYSLIPSTDEVVYSKNNDTLSSSVVTCGVMCDSSDDKHYELSASDYADHKLSLWYRVYYTDGTYDQSETAYTSAGVAVTTAVQKIAFYLYGLTNGTVDRTVFHDSEEVPVIADGLDGKGVEYIFFQQDTETPKPTIYEVDSERQADDYCPYTDSQRTTQWTDEPSGVGVNSKYEFYAQRKKVNGIWQRFGDVKLWDRYAVDGVSPYLMDLSNEQSFVNCDEDGTVLSGATYETSRIMIFKGTSYAFTDFNITVTPTGISCNNSSSAFSLTDAQKSTAQSNGYFTLTPSAITQNSAQITVTATLKTNTSIVLTAVYRINKNMGGQNGVIYSLMPSINVVHKSNSGTLTNSSMTVQIKKVVGVTSTTLTTSTQLSDEGLTLKYTQGTSTTENTISNPASIDTATLLGSSTYFTLLLKKGSTVVDKERINVVDDGDDAPVAFASPDKISVPCNTNGYVTSEVQQIVNFSMKVGTNDATITTDSYDSNLLPTGVSISPVTYGIVQIIIGTSATANGIQSGVTFHITGTCNGKTYHADVTVALIGSIKGATGQKGDPGSDGIYPRDCGLYDSNIATNETFGYAGYIYRKVGDFVIRDKVEYEIDGVMYGFLVKNYSASALITAAPTSASGDSNWESAGIVKTIIANTVFGTNANIGGFMTSSQRMRSTATTDGTTPKLLLDGNNGRIEAHEGLFTGFVRKKKTSITTSNIDNYKRSDITSNTVLDFDKCGSFVELNSGTAGYLTLPLLDSGLASYYNSDQKDLIRSHIGANLLIHNQTGSTISFNTKHEDNGYTSYSLPNGMFVELRCRTKSDSATKEIVYWEVIGSGVIV